MSEGHTERLNAALSGKYSIERQLGEGGMATVYLAQDLKHSRHVALKVLRPELAAVVGGERFLAEIETTAHLQHPHILPLFDSGEADSLVYYVMPYVEGESLRDRIDRDNQLSVEESVRIAVAVAGALEHAHRKGVIHRDIKPANILLQDGQPVVADFGIALAVGTAGAARLTETGLSVGTPYYMSPEQATGDQVIGPASDIYALGCVLYEMLVGDPPFVGRTAQAVLGRIIAGAPVTPSAERASIPINVDAVIRRALEKLPADRFASADELARALADSGFRHGEEAAETTITTSGPWKNIAIAALLAAVVALAALAREVLAPPSEPYDVGLDFDAPMRLGYYRNFGLARDGSFVVYEAAVDSTTVLWYRSLVPGDDESRVIPDTEGAIATPRISPDGRRVAFISARELKIVDLEEGTVSTVADASDAYGGGWMDDDLIFYAEDDGQVFRWVDPETGPVRESPAGYCVNPDLISEREQVLCGGGGAQVARLKNVADPLPESFFRRAGTPPGSESNGFAGSDFRIVEHDYLVYMSTDGALMGTRVLSFDSLTVGRPVTLVPAVRREYYSGVGQYAIADDGTLVYAPGVNADIGRLVRVTEGGQIHSLPIEEAAHLRFAFSPDGRRFASVVRGIQDQELRVYDLSGGRPQVYDESLFLGQPRWSPDGGSIVYRRSPSVDAASLVRLSLNSSEGPQDILTGEAVYWLFPQSYLSDELLLMTASLEGYPAAIVDLTVSPPTLDSLSISSFFMTMSPDERWLAYQNSGAVGLFLEPWPSQGGRRYSVDAAGIDPQWLSANEFVYYTFLSDAAGASSGASFYRVSVDPSADPPFSEPELWISDPRFADTAGPSFALPPDGSLVYLQAPAENRGYYLRVVPGWVDEMKAAVDEANRGR